MIRSKIKGARTGLFAKGFDDGLSIGLPTSRFDLPHPALHPRLLLLLHKVINEAFKILRAQHGSLASAGEDVITAQLFHLLENDFRYRVSRGQNDAIPGFDEELFDAVSRHSGATNYSGAKLKVEPDLFFKLKPAVGLRVLPTEYAIFAECKPVDATHAASSRYCDDGLDRFIDGDYAWAMQDALMIGYTRNRSIACHLAPAMREPGRRRRLKTILLPEQITGECLSHSEFLHVSIHNRGFPWSWMKGKSCAINIYHSWHCCN